MKVSRLIKLLKSCPQNAEIMLYYDGAARLIPNAAYWGKLDCWNGEEEISGECVILGQANDIYSPENPKWLFKDDSPAIPQDTKPCSNKGHD